MAQTGNKAVDDLVSGPKNLAYKFQSFMDKVPDPTKLFERKTTNKVMDRKVAEANEAFRKDAEKRKVGGSDGKVATAQKKAATKKTPQRKRVAGK